MREFRDGVTAVDDVGGGCRWEGRGKGAREGEEEAGNDLADGIQRDESRTCPATATRRRLGSHADG